MAGLPVFVFGRSIGACAAVHTITVKQEAVKFAGLILDSGLMELKSLPMVQQLSAMIGGAQILCVRPRLHASPRLSAAGMILS